MKKNIKHKKIFIYIFLIVFLFLIYYSVIFYIEYKNNLEIEINNKKVLIEIEKKKLLEETKLKEKEKEENFFLNNLDLKTDSSLTKFVSAKVSFENKLYIPKNLRSISGKYIYDAKGGTQILREEAKNALDKMSESFFNDTGKKIVVVSAYRSYLYQKGIKDRGCPDNLCAKAGYSEHQSGLAVDLWAATSFNAWQSKNYQIKYKWLKENASNFGFTNTYQRGLKVDTYEIEPWHWRYVGIDLAKYLEKNNLTIAEFYKEMNNL